MLLIIGLILLAYGYAIYSGDGKSRKKTGKAYGRAFPEGFDRLHRLAGMLLILMGLLLALAYFII
ncbi:hypothetical protein ADIAL_0531 [Alkalibacterium sp. AK22]|uniref:hypothetical protein n=1 Tax=Alkalibacterium sp. AK22 TaxID=1229520 RepID=UPI00044AA626|nr:hypothetical protein [Alkalibacterium sp. AK22]EXJ24011.1 hypothetical protein ADIAL_0531 [Alkalibacterium sp. AK22]